MAETLPSPPPSPVPDNHQSTEQTLSERLDALLEGYLDLLDTYTTLREALSKSFSAGFLSLAQAQRNANSTIGVGRRFGQEGYDERMKALRMVQIDGSEAHEKLTFSVHKRVEQSDGREEQGDRIENKDSADKSKTDAAYRDPVTWFGILVPPALRQTQAQFATAVQDTVPDLLSVECRMSQVEEEIWDVRKQLGLLGEYKR